MSDKMTVPDLSHVEEGGTQEKSIPDLDSQFTPAQQAAIRRKVDIRLCFPLGMIYAISLVDKTNLSSANIAGMSTDLGLGIGVRYSVIALVLFTTYVTFQFPGTILMIRYGIHHILPILCAMWGLILIGMGFANQWYDLVIYRMVLGALESTVFPGCFFLLSAWYVRYEVHKRYSFFYIIANICSAFAGILAYGLMQMKGLGGLNGWRWIFIIEGIMTIGLAITARFFIVGLPHNARAAWNFLNDAEIQWMVDRVEKDRQDAVLEKWTLKLYLSGLKDYKPWAYGILSYLATTTAYGIAYFLPIILQGGLGFTLAQAQCLVAPPYIYAAFVTWGTAWIGDKFHTRGVIVVINNLQIIVGLLLLVLVSSQPVRYFGVFLGTGGVTASVPAIYAYQSNNIRGQWKRGVTTALMVFGGGIGGISGSLVFRAQDAPQYQFGMYYCIGSGVVSTIIVAIMTVTFHSANKKARAGQKVIEGLEGFYYTL